MAAGDRVTGFMGFTITEFESTPNPNAVKCWLDRPISAGPRSFLNAEMAAGDDLAAALFAAGAVCVLLNGAWLTVNKTPADDWTAMKKRIRRVLAETEPDEGDRDAGPG